MSEAHDPESSILSQQAARQEQIIARFEDAHRQGQRPAIDDYLSGEGGERLSLLVELVHIDLECRLKAGQPARVEEYLERYPELTRDEDAVVELISAEYALRRRGETGLAPEQFQQRFPQLGDKLGKTLAQDAPSLPRKRYPIRLNCPHCHNPIAVVDDRTTDDVICPSCGSTFRLGRDRSISWQPEKLPRLGKFELLEPIARGGFGTVYRARDTELDRIVAVKIPRSGSFATGEDEDRFVREARSVAQLHHPGIVPVYEVGHGESFPYIVAEYVHGVSLSDALTGRRFAFREAAEITAQVAEALDHSHRQGVIHRDLKPSNIMLREEQGRLTALLMDFGLARREEGELTVTLDGQVLGTPRYMSPEQARGEGHRVDGRSDVYSLGVILYELLAGEPPFRGNMRMLLYQVLNAEPHPPRRLNDRIPRDLETICLKCLEKSPDGRYATAGELAEELRRFLRGEPIRARPVGTMARSWRWCKRQPVVASLTATVAITLLFGTLVCAYFAAGEAVRAREAIAERNRANENAADAEKRTREAETTLVDMQTMLGLKAGERGNPYEAVFWFANAAEMARHDPQRQLANRVRFQAWVREIPVPMRAGLYRGQHIEELLYHSSGKYLMVVSAETGVAILDLEAAAVVSPPSAGAPISVARWNASGNWLAIGRSDGRVECLPFPIPRVGKPVFELSIGEPVRVLAFSPDGHYLASAGRHVRVWDCEKARFASSNLAQPDRVTKLCFNAAGDRLAVACADDSLRMYELGRNHPVDAPAFDPVPHVAAFRPAFVDNDRKLLTVAHCSDSEVEGIIVWRDANTGQQVRAEPFVSHDSSTICSFAVSPDGQTLAECGFRSIRLRRIPGGEVIGSLDGHKNWVLDSAWAPDGGGFLTASMDRSARVWSLRMGKPLAAVPHQDEVVRVAFSPDGQSFATAQADGLVRLWRMPEPSKKYHIHLGPPNDFRAVMSRDGRLVMPTGWSLNRGQSSTRVYTVANGSPAGPSLSAPGLINGGDFSPDGSFVVLASSLPENVDQRGWREIRWAQQPGCITFWDWRSGKQLFAPLRTRTEPVDAAYSPDGTVVVVVCAGGDILIVDRQGSVVRQCRIHGRSVQPGLNPKRCVRFAPDGRVFVTLGLGPICAWETATLRARYTIGHADALLDAEFSRDGKWLAAASIDKAAEVWDAGTGERAGPPLRHPGWVFTAEFSPDGEQLLTSCRDKMARLWNWRTGELACAAIEHEDEVFDARFSADGRWLLTTDRYGTLRMWDRIFGESVAPSQRLSGTTGRTLIVVPDGKSVLVAGEMCGLDAFDLSHLTNLDSAYGLNITAQD